MEMVSMQTPTTREEFENRLNRLHYSIVNGKMHFSSDLQQMPIEELLLRLNYEERQILKCEYTSTGGGTRPIYKNNKIVDTKPELFFQIINHNYE